MHQKLEQQKRALKLSSVKLYTLGDLGVGEGSGAAGTTYKKFNVSLFQILPPDALKYIWLGQAASRRQGRTVTKIHLRHKAKFAPPPLEGLNFLP